MSSKEREMHEQFKQFKINITDTENELIAYKTTLNNIENIINNMNNYFIKFIRTVLQNPLLSINQLYNGKTLINNLIENGIDDEEIYNLAFLKGGYINYELLINDNSKEKLSFMKDGYINYELINDSRQKILLIEKNIGLIKSMVKNGFYYKNNETDNIIHIRNPVIFFTKNSNFGMVQALLDNKASVNEKDENGLTPLFYAIKDNNIDFFNILLYRYSPNLKIKNNNGQTPLEFALSIKNLSQKKYFTSKLLNYEKIFSSLKNDMDYVTNFLSMLKQGNYEMAKTLLRQIKNINVIIPDQKDQNLDIMSFVIDNIIDDEEVFDILYEKGAYIKYSYFAPKKKKKLSLMVQNHGLIKSIVHHGILFKNDGSNVATPVINITTPVYFFTKLGKNDFVLKLLEFGASVDEIDEEDGMSPLYFTIKSNNQKLFHSLLYEYDAQLALTSDNSKCILTTILNISDWNNKLLFLFEFRDYLNRYQYDINETFKIEVYLIPSKILSEVELTSCVIELDDNMYESKYTLPIAIYDIKSTTILKVDNIPDNNDFTININEANDEDTNDDEKALLESKRNNELLDTYFITEWDNTDELKKILESFPEDLYNVIQISYLIKKKIDNEDIYNMLFEKHKPIECSFINNKNKIHLIESNTGLIKSMVKNGFYYEDETGIQHIRCPVIFFSKHSEYEIIKKLIQNNASIDEVDENGWSPIFYAINNCNSELCKILLNDCHPNLNLKNKDGQIPLEFALSVERVNSNMEDIINELINEYCSSNDIVKFIIEILNKKDYSMVKKLLNQINDIHIFTSKQGKDVMNYLINNNICDEEIFNLLFEKKAYIEYNYILTGNNKIISLIKNNEGFIKSIAHNGIHVKYDIPKATTPSSIKTIKTPLIFFIKLKKYPIVLGLLENGASVNEIDEDNGNTPLHCAIKNKKLSLFDTLLNIYHADVHHSNKLGKTPLMEILGLSDENAKQSFITIIEKYKKQFDLSSTLDDDKKLMFLMNQINICIESNTIMDLIDILEHSSLDINCTLPNTKTVLNYFIENRIDNEKIYNYLFKKGAYIDNIYVINSKNSKYNNTIDEIQGLIKSIAKNGFYYKKKESPTINYVDTPVIFFIKNHKKEMIFHLLNNDKKLIEEMDEDGLTPIFCAIKNSNVKLFRVLLNNYNPNIYHKNKYGQTLIEYITETNLTESINKEQLIFELNKIYEKKEKAASKNKNEKEINKNNNEKEASKDGKKGETSKNENELTSNIKIAFIQNNKHDAKIQKENDEIILSSAKEIELKNQPENELSKNSDSDSNDDSTRNDDSTLISVSPNHDNLKEIEDVKEVNVLDSYENNDDNENEDKDDDENEDEDEDDYLDKPILNSKYNLDDPNVISDSSNTTANSKKKSLKKRKSLKEIKEEQLIVTEPTLKNEYMDQQTIIDNYLNSGIIEDNNNSLLLNFENDENDDISEDSSSDDDENMKSSSPTDMDHWYTADDLPQLFYLIQNDNLKDLQLASKNPNFTIRINEMNEDGDTPLIYAIKHDITNKNMVIQILLSSGADANQPDKESKTPLIHAIEKDQPEIVDLLLKYHADINHTYDNGLNPLKLAIVKNNITIVKQLLAKRKEPKTN